MISYDFAYWIGRQDKPTILASQADSVSAVLDRLGNGDLISILLNGRDDHAIEALHLLRRNFMDEMSALEERR